MPKIYLSPSTQEFNNFVTGESEEYYMNLLADALVPYLYANGISYVRNTKDMTALDNIKASNSKDYDLHLALHSNAAPEGEEGKRQGTEVYYFPYSYRGERMADIIAENFSNIYPHPELIKTVPTTSLGEVDRTRAPSVLVEAAYHDNPSDAMWIAENIDGIARILALSLAEYFNIPFNDPAPPVKGIVVTHRENLNIRNLPSLHSAILATAPRGAEVIVFGESGGWAKIFYNGILGFADENYIRLL